MFLVNFTYITQNFKLIRLRIWSTWVRAFYSAVIFGKNEYEFSGGELYACYALLRNSHSVESSLWSGRYMTKYIATEEKILT